MSIYKIVSVTTPQKKELVRTKGSGTEHAIKLDNLTGQLLVLIFMGLEVDDIRQMYQAKPDLFTDVCTAYFLSRMAAAGRMDALTDS